jgi:hypothetical protein
MNFSDGGFMGYYVDKVLMNLSITDNRNDCALLPANNTGLAWYMILPQQNQRKR